MPRPKRHKTRASRKNTRRVAKHSRLGGFFIQSHRNHLITIVMCIAVIGGSILNYLVKNPPPRDHRPDRLDAYFSEHDMPLAGYGKNFVAVADACDMDWRLLPAIAVRESSGGKHMQYNNPFGWGGAHIPFQRFDEAINVVGSNLCGDNPNTAKWYSTTSTYKKLYYYNGTVIPSYPKEVQWIMEQF